MRHLRRWWWAIVLVLVVAVRIALPGIVRRQIEQRASDALHARVTVADVELALVAGGVALNDVAVRAVNQPPEAPPLIAWHRLGVHVRWRPLFHKIIRLSSVELVEPRVALDRLQSGDLNLTRLAPPGSAETPPAVPPPAQQATPWAFGIDYLSLTRGNVQFRDFFVPNAEPA